MVLRFELVKFNQYTKGLVAQMVVQLTHNQ